MQHKDKTKVPSYQVNTFTTLSTNACLKKKKEEGWNALLTQFVHTNIIKTEQKSFCE